MQISAPLPTPDLRALGGENQITIELRGQVDMANHQQLQVALAAIDRAKVKTVRVNMSQLDFCDITGFRQILSFAAESRREGRRVIIAGASPTIKTMATVFGAAQDLEFA